MALVWEWDPATLTSVDDGGVRRVTTFPLGAVDLVSYGVGPRLDASGPFPVLVLDDGGAAVVPDESDQQVPDTGTWVLAVRRTTSSDGDYLVGLQVGPAYLQVGGPILSAAVADDVSVDLTAAPLSWSSACDDAWHVYAMAWDVAGNVTIMVDGTLVHDAPFTGTITAGFASLSTSSTPSSSTAYAYGAGFDSVEDLAALTAAVQARLAAPVVRDVDFSTLASGRATTVAMGDWTLTSDGVGVLVDAYAGGVVIVPDTTAGTLAVGGLTIPTSGAIGMLVAWPDAADGPGFSDDVAWPGFGFIDATGTAAATMGAHGLGGMNQDFSAVGDYAPAAPLVDGDFHPSVLKWVTSTDEDGLSTLEVTGWFDGESVWGTIRSNMPISSASPWTLALAAYTGTATPPRIAYLGVREGDIDAAAWSAAMAPTPPPVSGLVASTSLGLTATATLSVDDLDDEPELPVLPDGADQDAPEPPEPQDPPAGVDAPLLRWVSETMPSPVLDAQGFPVDWAPTATRDTPLGRLQIVIDGVDVTWWGDVATPIPDWTRVEPFGSGDATITFPQITTFHAEPSWCKDGAAVDIRLVETGGTIHHRFAGVIEDFGHSEDPSQTQTPGAFVVHACGVVFADDLQLRKPAFTTAPQDIGSTVAHELNATISRRHDKVAAVVTGCLTSLAGAWEPRVTGWVQQLLATAVKGGRQWTVQCAVRSPVIALKDTTTVTWSVHNGQRGVAIDLDRDYSQAPNAIYGEGITTKGGRWRNAKYPGWRPDDTPAYPFSAPSSTIHLGVSDADTTTGDGVSRWQAKAGVPVTGVYRAADRAACRRLQEDAGISVDGIVGPQTWAATFGTGSNTGTLECLVLPLAVSPSVQPRLYGPDGDDLGANPRYSAKVLRVERKIDFGQGVAKGEATRAAREILKRDSDPGWVGTVTLQIDPPERSRYLIDEGSNGTLRGVRGRDLKVHVAKAEYSEDSVTLTVDTNARDYPTLASIRQRERDAVDPAQAIISKRTTKASVTDSRATFDAESPAGQVPRHALFAGLWTVIRVPFGSYGSIVRTTMTTSGPASPFAVAVFDGPVTAARLLEVVGNPLTAESNPWDDAADTLDELGLLMAWGWASQPCGYYPKTYTDPNGATANPVTGRMVDDASWDYASVRSPWLWVAEFASASCYIEGRFLPGVDD